MKAKKRTFSKIGILTILTLLTVGVIGMTMLTFSIGGFYHPNEAMGNLAFRYAGIFAALYVLNWFAAIVIVSFDTSASAVKRLLLTLGIFLLLVLGQILLGEVPSNYKVTYYLGQDAYSIPWEYNPINGSPEEGGTYFVIHVSYPGFRGEYEDTSYFNNHQLTLSRNIPDQQELEDGCRGIALSTAANSCFIREGFLYNIHYQGETIPLTTEETTAFQDEIVRLFDSFKVGS